MSKWDCVVFGELCVDLPIRPLVMNQPLEGFELLRIDPIQPGGGGIVANSGVALARLGTNVTAVAAIGNDFFGRVLLDNFEAEGLDTSNIIQRDDRPTSHTAVLIGDDGEHTFAFYAGASRTLDKQTMLESLDVFAESRYALFGYYGSGSFDEHNLSTAFQAIRATGCKVAMDASAGGGSMNPLAEILPHVDIYVPSLIEATSQTQQNSPREMIETFRQLNSEALLGIKLGTDGVLLSPEPDEFIQVPAIKAPGHVVDTTGAGDSFYAGLIAGLCRGLAIPEAARIGTAAGACCVTEIGAATGIKDFDETRRLAGVEMSN